MKATDGIWQNRFRSMGSVLLRRRSRAVDRMTEATGRAVGSEARRTAEAVAWPVRIDTAGFAFRGYDVTNLGRSQELLEHSAYGPVVHSTLEEASAIASEALHQPVDLVAHVQRGGETSLADFPQDVAMIVAMEVAQLRLLEMYFEVPVRAAKLSFGYSIGELAALVLGGMFRLDQLLPIPLSLAADCAELAADTTMGVLFTRGPAISPDDVERLCLAVSSEGRGLVGPSAYLSPNTALILGQGDTLDRLERVLHDHLPPEAMLRRKPNRWPPLHTPLVRLRHIPDRTAVALYQIEGGTQIPSPAVISCVTGKPSYDPLSCRELLTQWTDHPQRLWSAIDETLTAGTETVVHVGPAPNLVPATFSRLANNVSKYLGHNKYLHRLGRGVVTGMNRHTWLAHLLPAQAALLRAPFLEHVILEDWLLEQPIR